MQGLWQRERAAILQGAAVGLLGLLTALVLQMAWLGALRFDARHVEAAFAPAKGSTTRLDAEGRLILNTAREGAAIAAEGLDLLAHHQPTLAFDAGPNRSPLVLEVAWIGSRDPRRPATARYLLPASSEHRTVRLVLAGQPQWRDSVSRFALVARGATQGVAQTPEWRIGTMRFEAASPATGLTLLAASSVRPESVLVSGGQPIRLLPLTLILVTAGLLAVALARLLPAPHPARRAAWLAGTTIAVGLVALLWLVLPYLWRPTTLAPIASTVFSVTCLLTALRLIDRSRPRAERALMPLAAVAIGVAAHLARALEAVTAASAAAGAIALVAAATAPAALKRLAPLFVVLPLVALGGFAQGFLDPLHPAIAEWRSRLVDPSPVLGQLLASSFFVVVLALLAVALTLCWPAQRTPPNGPGVWRPAFVAAAVSLVTVLVFAALRSDVALGGAVLVPAVLALVAATLPVLATVAPTAAPASATVRTEEDLSADARRLFEAARSAFVSTLAAGTPGEARRHLETMRKLAPDGSHTLWAQLGLALSEGDLAGGRTPFERLYARRPLASEQLRFTLLEYAWRRRDQTLIAELAPEAPDSPTRTQALAWLALMQDGPAAAVAQLDTSPHAAALLAQRIELRLLLNDLPAVQALLEQSGLPIESVPGTCFLSRLTLRAVGPARHRDKILQTVTWHPDLALAQIAMGELLLIEGNSAGAMVRFRRALELDPTLWPLEVHLTGR